MSEMDEFEAYENQAPEGGYGVQTDIAVVEYLDYLGEWVPLFAIGPDRDEGVIDEYSHNTHRECDLRIRYLNRPRKP